MRDSKIILRNDNLTAHTYITNTKLRRKNQILKFLKMKIRRKRMMRLQSSLYMVIRMKFDSIYVFVVVVVISIEASTLYMRLVIIIYIFLKTNFFSIPSIVNFFDNLKRE